MPVRVESNYEMKNVYKEHETLKDIEILHYTLKNLKSRRKKAEHALSNVRKVIDILERSIDQSMVEVVASRDICQLIISNMKYWHRNDEMIKVTLCLLIQTCGKLDQSKDFICCLYELGIGKILHESLVISTRTYQNNNDLDDLILIHFEFLKKVGDILDFTTISIRDQFHELCYDSCLPILRSQYPNQELHEAALVVLNLVVASSNHLSDQIVKSYNTIIEMAVELSDDAAIVRETCHFVSLVARHGDVDGSLFSSSVNSWVVDVLKKHRSNRFVLSNCCEAIADMVFDSCFASEILQRNGMQEVLVAAKTHPDERTLQVTALNAIEHLVQFNISSTDAMDCLSHVFDIMLDYSDDAALQCHACNILYQLLNDDKYNLAQSIGEMENQLPIHNAVVAVLLIHSNDPLLGLSFCMVLKAMTSCDNTLQQYLVGKGIYVNTIQLLRSFPDNKDLLSAGYSALRALATDNILQKEQLIKYGILDDVIDSLKLYRDDQSIIGEIIALIACLVTDLDIVRHQCIVEKVHLHIKTVLARHLNDCTVAEICLEALALFAGSEEQDLSHDLDIIGCVLETMQIHSIDSSLNQKALVLLQLVVSNYLIHETEVLKDVAQTITKLMKRFPDDNDMQVECCVTYQVLAEISSSFKEALIEHDSHVMLFHTLEASPFQGRVSGFVLETILVLADQQDTKDILLKDACANGYLRAVRCLLKVGANVEIGNGIDLPLQVAVENGNVDVVRALLPHNPTELQSTLKISLKKQNNLISGLLLKKIGLNREVGSLAWSGLKLENLSLEMLLPSLVNEDEINMIQTAGESSYDHQIERVLLARKLRRSPKQSPLSTSPTNNGCYRSISNSFDEDDDCWRRARSISGALLPFNQHDPRLSLPLADGCRTIYPCTSFGRNSYPGYPDSQLSSDECQGAFSSEQYKSASLPSRKIIKRSLTDSLLVGPYNGSSQHSPVRKTGNTFPKISLPNKPCRSSIASPILRLRRRGDSSVDSLDLIDVDETSAIIRTIDLSCNELENIDVLTFKNVSISMVIRRLEKLDLSQNQLEEIPSILYESLASLKEYHCKDNLLTEFPYELIAHHRICIINMAGNHIKQIKRHKLSATLSMVKLNLDNNDITCFPGWIRHVFPGLSHLSIKGNYLTTLPNSDLGLTQLRELNLSENDLKSIPDEFLLSCTRLEGLKLSDNSLSSLPDPIDLLLHSLHYVDLSTNQLCGKSPFHLPKFILELPALRHLNISHNSITGLPDPTSWASASITELIFNGNKIRSIGFQGCGTGKLSNLSYLSLSKNRITSLPPEIGTLLNLTVLDISDNPLSKLPDEIGQLKNLYDLRLNGLKLDLDPSVLNAPTKEIVSFLHSKLNNAVPYYRMKLMLVGLAGRGKTSLLRQLQGQKHSRFNVATIGVEVKEWTLKKPKSNTLMGRNKKFPPLQLSTWDFAGQEDFYCTHQSFLTSRAVYLAVYDASRGSAELELLRPWLLSIKSGAPDSQVILVGTHADELRGATSALSKENITKLKESIDHFANSPGFPLIKSSAIVCCTKENSSIESLRDKIYDIVRCFTFKGQAIIGQLVPKSYVQLEDALYCEAVLLQQNKQPPIVSRSRLVEITSSANILLNSQDLTHAVRFLHEIGVVLHFDDPLLKLDDLYFIDPKWLCQMMARVVTVKEINPYINTCGILRRTDALKLFNGDAFPDSFINQYLGLLRKFEVLLPLNDDTFIVPSKLPSARPEYSSMMIQQQNHAVVRLYRFPYVPIGFWPRLISRLVLTCPAMFERKLMQDIKPTRVEYWRDGVLLSWTPSAFIAVYQSRRNQNTVKIRSVRDRYGCWLVGIVVDCIDSLLEEWYPGLNDSNGDSASNLVQRSVLCSECPNDVHEFPYAYCIEASCESKSIYCETTGTIIPLIDVAPDIIFADLDPRFLINEDELTPYESGSTLLGDGGFSQVHRAKYWDTCVAVKIFHSNNQCVAHRLLRQELNILCQLRHPNLISLVGVRLLPRSVVMEIAPLGSLSSVLESGRPLGRGMHLRIATQVASGLKFLHDHDIIYRDLKPGNILIFSLSMGISTNAKISDYGISQYITPGGLSASEGTPGYRAPEVTQIGVCYNQKIDIYSFGVTIFVMISDGKMPFGKSYHQTDHDDYVTVGRPMDSLTNCDCPPWPDMEDLIENCLSFNQAKRPCAEEICRRLGSADFSCLKRYVGVSKNQTVECMVAVQRVVNNETVTEVWTGSGDSVGPTSQLSWFSLSHWEKGACRGTIVKDGRILCMESLPNYNYVITGTKQGRLIVFDVETHTKLLSLPPLPDSVLCLLYQSYNGMSLLFVGLANGILAVYNVQDLSNQDCEPLIVNVCKLIGLPSMPTRCLAISKKNLVVGCGSKIVLLPLDNFKYPSYEDDNRCPIIRSISCNNHTMVMNLVVGATLWVSLKDDQCVYCLDVASGKSRRMVDCKSLLQSKGISVTSREARVVSLYLKSRCTLWIGTGSGHVILVEPLRDCRLLAVFHRHTSAVRSIISAQIISPGKPLSYVLTGSFGFYFRPDLSKCDDQSGYVIVWDADISKQIKYLESETKSATIRSRRESLFNAITGF